MKNKFSFYLFAALLFLTLLTPLMVYRDLLFPFVTSKAFYLRIVVELALPFYVYLLAVNPKARPNIKNPLTVSVAAFWLINLITAFFGINLIKSLWGNFERMGGVYYLLHLSLMYFYLLTFAQLSPKGFKLLLKTAVWFAGFLSIYGIFTAMGMRPLVTDPSLPRISIFFGNPIYVGSFMILPMFLAAYFALRAETRGGKALYWFWVAVQLAAVYLSGTRGAVVGLVLGVFLGGVAYVAAVGSNRVRLWGGAALAVFIVAMGLLFANHSRLPQGTTLHRVFNLNDSNTQSRLIEWRTALKGAQEFWYFGTGPENYYFVANKYHNPEITKYDPSWFDKPHNFLLEVLVTTGIFGFTAYAAMLAFCVYACYRAFKNGALSLLEFLLLVTGMVVYQIQNLFVFDNVSSSLMFYAYLACCAILWQESAQSKTGGKAAAAEQGKVWRASPEMAYAVFGISAVVAVYAVYASNALPMQAAGGVNYGYAYAGVDPKKSLGFFEDAVNTPFNFDLGETASRFGESALGMAYNQNVPKDLVVEALNKSIDALKAAVAAVNNNPIYYQRLANAILVRDSITGKPFSQEGMDDLNRAIELAPRRTEARLLKAQVLFLGGRQEDGLALAKQAIDDAPTNMDIHWQYANMLRQAGREEEAVKQAEDLLGKGYRFRNWKDAAWLIDIYRKNKQYDKVFALFEKLDQLQLLDVDGQWAMAQIYAEGGEKTRAREIAQKLVDSASKYKNRAQEFLQKLGQ